MNNNNPLLIDIEPISYINNKKQDNNWSLYGNTENNNNNKYAPQSTKDIFRNKDNIIDMKNWIQSKMNNIDTQYDYAYISGRSGTGKSEFIRMCFKDLNYNIIEYDQNINKAELEILKESILYSSIEMIFGGQSKKGVIIDNISDNLASTQLTELLKLLKKEKITSPTIFIGDSLSKSSDLLKGNVLYIEYEEPHKEDIVKLAKRICKNEKIKISQLGLDYYINSCVILDISNNEKCYNIRNFLSSISLLVESNSKINKDGVIKQQIIMAKDIEPDIYTTLHHFIDPKFNNDIKNIRLTSMYTSSLIYENYLNIINKDIPLDKLSTIADYNSMCDIYKKYILRDQVWELGEYMGIFGTYIPGTIIKQYYKPYKKMKINGNFTDIVIERGYGMNINDISYTISNILFPLDPTAIWIKHMKKSSQIFYRFMKDNYIIDITKAIKYIDRSYKFSKNYDTNIIRKIKTKFRTEWKLLE